MKKCPQFVMIALGFALAGVTSCATEELARSRRVRGEALQLVRADVGEVKFVEKPALLAPHAPPTGDEDGDVLVLDPVEVLEKRPPDLRPPPRETPAQEFFRTGTLMEKVGKKTTARLWAKGDRGLMLSFSR